MKSSSLALTLILALSVGAAVFSATAAADKAGAASNLVEIQVLVTAINGEAGGVDILRVVPVLQVRDAAGGAAVERNRLLLGRAMRARLRSVSARDLIPPGGDTLWLERELHKIADRVLAPVRLEDLFFRELTID